MTLLDLNTSEMLRMYRYSTDVIRNIEKELDTPEKWSTYQIMKMKENLEYAKGYRDSLNSMLSSVKVSCID